MRSLVKYWGVLALREMGQVKHLPHCHRHHSYRDQYPGRRMRRCTEFRRSGKWVIR